MKHENVKLIKTKWGFYQYHPLPDDDELEQYYAQKYYQEGLGSYEISYSDEEIAWFKLKNEILCKKAVQLLQNDSGCMMDVGCGEGWLMSEFHQAGFFIQGLDFSISGIHKFHPHLLDYFEQGDIYNSLEKTITRRELFDIIALCNVIEHVKHPEVLLCRLKSLMKDTSLLIITAPNDFSVLHRYLLQNKIITDKWWLCYPDHLSYFNKETMHNLLMDMGYEIRGIMADNPIDLNILNDNSNYISDPSKGKNSHIFRVRTDNFLGSLGREKLIQLYELTGEMGIGRNLTYFCSKKV